METKPAYVASRTLTEARLAGIWAEGLGLDKIGVVPLSTQMSFATIERLAANIDHEVDAATPSLVIPIQAEGCGTPLVDDPTRHDRDRRNFSNLNPKTNCQH